MSKIKVTKIRSTINRPKTQKLTMESLGLRKVGQSVQHNDNESIRGMVDKIKHLVLVEEVK